MFLHSVIAGVIGTTISVALLAIAPRLGLTRSNWHFFHDGQAKLMRTQNKFLIYFPRFILGGLLLPAIFYYIWGPSGYLGIYPQSNTISAMLLALAEAPILVLGLQKNLMNQPPESTRPFQLIAVITHLNLGFWIGWLPTVM